ncbi:aminopeptidase P family protein [Histidinibacterium aquaticum]|uniref:Aminopeptidase P family protein n=2 Tax=Histidinibacterium aquaticum TaxID=2613962 RepID=A0A5J5GG82_9RHOB|nr:aminopeptidase P family protein [Histidinibacterium aquaticum]
MATRGQDALFLTSPQDIFYVTGFLTRFWESPARPWFLVLPKSGEPLAIIPEIGVELMSHCAVGEIRAWPAPVPGDDGVSLLTECLTSLVPEGGRLGVPMGAETNLRMPLADWQSVRQSLGQRHVVDATETLHRVREIKSEPEIEAIRATCGIADAAFDRMPELVAGAATLETLFRRFQIALLEEGADWVSYVAGGAGPEGYGTVIAPASGQPLRRGDIVMLDTGAVRNGYFCDFDRNFAIGRPSDAMKRAYAVLDAATEAALGQLRPGMTAKDAHRVLSEAMTDAGGVPAGGRLGHGLGVALTEWPSFTPRDETELRAGMVLAIEPGVEVGDGTILVQEENVVLRDDGPELLSTRAARELPVIAP